MQIAAVDGETEREHAAIGTGRITVRVLGTIAVSIGDHPIRLSPAERNLVAHLAAAGPDGLHTDRLADALWADRLPASWSSSLRNSISRLNTKIPPQGNGERLITMRSSHRALAVDPDGVDLWRLLHWSQDPDRPAEPALLAGQPLPGCEIDDRLRAATERALAARQDVIARWEANGSPPSRQLLAEIRYLCAEEPQNDDLLDVAVRLHLAAGDRPGVDRLLELVGEELRGLQLPPSTALLAAREAVERHRRDRVATERLAAATPARRSAAMQALLATPLAGRAELVAELSALADADDCAGISLHGNPGTGKTRLAVEVASRLADQGCHTAYVPADQDSAGTLRPFLDAFRGLRQVVKPYLENLHVPDTRSRCWTEILQFFEQLYGTRPLCLVVDDPQWFDPASRELLVSLCRADLDFDLFVIAVGRQRERTATWPGWTADLTRLGIRDVPVRALDRSAIVELIEERHTGASPVQVSVLADHLLELSSGIPVVADWLLDRVDTTTFEIPIGEVGATGWAAMVRALDDDVCEPGGVAAMLGMQFNLADLRRLADLPHVLAGRAIDTLVDEGFIIELPMPDEYRFVHVLAAEALAQTIPSRRQRTLHAEAYDLFDDVHRRAWHADRAVPVIDPATAASALVAAARRSFADGDNPRAMRFLQQAQAVDEATVGPADEVMLLEASERSGVRVASRRRAATRAALAAGDMSLALAAASSGLPDAEALEGDVDRVDLLTEIEPAQLTRDERIAHGLHLSRQLMLLGRLDEARACAAEVSELAESADEQAMTWLAVQLPGGLGATTVGPDEMPWFDRVTSPALRARIDQAVLVNSLAAGGSRACAVELARHKANVKEQGLTTLEWFANMFEVTALTDQGDRDSARAVSAEARRIGLRAGLRVASGAYETQRFAWKYHDRTHGRFHSFFDDPSSPAEFTDNIFFAATGIASRFAHGTEHGDDELRRFATASVPLVFEEAASSPFQPVVVGIIADVIAASGKTDYIDRARAVLTPRLGTHLLVAGGIASLGPCAGVLARLATDRDERLDLLLAAVDDADRNDLPLWQVLCRLQLFDVLGPDDPGAVLVLADARSRAVTPWLKGICARIHRR